MLFKDILEESFSAIFSNKTRSLLTMLGIIIGIASVIVMISLGQGAKNQMTSSIESLGSNLLTIIPGASRSGIMMAARGTAQTLKLEDVKALSQIEGVLTVIPINQRSFQVISPKGTNIRTTIMGSTPEIFETRNMTLVGGYLFTTSQNNNLERVAVLGQQVATDLFDGDDPLNKTIRVNGVNFQVIGIASSNGAGGSFVNLDDMIYVPINTFNVLLSRSDYLSTILIKAQNKDVLSSVQDEAIVLLSKNHRVDPNDPDFTIISQQDILGTLNQVLNTFTIFLASVAGISLVVGGIGVMNMMLTSVTERIKEIGLRKAIGAKNSEILKQFLFESIVLTFSGGILGIILGVLISLIVSKVFGIASQVSFLAIVLAFSISASIGIFFGYWPAKKAASLDPIEALRYE